MTSIMMTVTGARAQATVTGPLTSGMTGIPVTIEYDASWDGLHKNLVCRCSEWGAEDGVYRATLNVEDTAVVAHEVMKSGQYLFLGIEGRSADGKLVIPTTWAMCGKIQSGANTTDDLSADPTLPVWEQMQKEIEQIKQNPFTEEQVAEIQACAQTAVDAADSAERSKKSATAASNLAAGSAEAAEQSANSAQTSMERAEASASSAAYLANETLRLRREAEAAAERAENAASALNADQINALEGLLGVTAFIKPDVSAEIAAFRAAFGLDGGDDPDEPVDPEEPEEPEEPEQPGGDDGFDSGLIDLTELAVVDCGGATHQVLNEHTMVVNRPSASDYSYIIINGLTPGATYDLYIEPYEGAGNASVYANKTSDATDDSGYGRAIQSNTSIADKYTPLHFALNDGEYGILIYCYGSVTGLRLVAAEG